MKTETQLKITIGALGVGLVIDAYLVLVLASLWGWFAAGQFGLPALTYLQMAGLLLIQRAIWWKSTESPDAGRFEALMTLVGVCVPDDKRKELREEMEFVVDGQVWKVVSATFERCMAITTYWSIGWIVHSFLL